MVSPYGGVWRSAMQVHNVHERVLDAPAEAVGRLLDDIGGPHDALWPSPEWSPMWLDGPPAVGTAGGHGSLRYRVTTYEPGRKIVFTLDPGQDLSGWHGFEVVAPGPSSPSAPAPGDRPGSERSPGSRGGRPGRGPGRPTRPPSPCCPAPTSWTPSPYGCGRACRRIRCA